MQVHVSKKSLLQFVILVRNNITAFMRLFENIFKGKGTKDNSKVDFFNLKEKNYLPREIFIKYTGLRASPKQLPNMSIVPKKTVS